MTNVYPLHPIPETCDVAIVGAGPAGATLAGLLALRGLDVVLLEKDTFPRDKLCGEFLSYEARPILERLGVARDLLERAHPITHSRIFSRDGAELEMALPGEAIGINRLALDETLFDRACALGAHGYTRAEVREIEPDGTLHVRRSGDRLELVTARLVVGAWGRRTRLDRVLERPFSQAHHPWVGMKQHHVPVDDAARVAIDGMLAHTVELHAFEGGYCGINYAGDGLINVCALLSQDAFDRMRGKRWQDLSESMQRSCESLRERLKFLTPAPRATQAVAQVPFERKELFDGALFWLGDAAGMITPMTGDGQAMAIESASLLVPILEDVLHALDEDREATQEVLLRAGVRWESTWHEHFAARHRLGRLLQGMLVRPRLADGFIRLGARVPVIPQTLVQATRGT